MIFDGIIDDLGKLQKSKPTLRIGNEELAKLKSKQIEYSKNIFCEESRDFKTFLERHSVSSEVTENIISQEDLIAPTKVQSQVIPKLLEGHNIICSAPTGSGKTLAYSLPIVELILRNEFSDSKSNSPKNSNDERFCEPLALIITHVPMLVEQIRCEIDKISSATPIMVQKATNLLNDPNLPLSDILIGTPKDILRFQHSFDGVKYIVVDECDQLFENAKISHYKDQISTILRRCINPQLSHAFFSATFSPKLEKWAQSYFNDPQCIYIGQKNLTNCFVEQSLRFTGSEYGKILELKKLIRQSNTELIPLIIFVQSKPRALDCVVELQREFPTLKTAAIYSSRNRNDHQEKQSAAFDGTEDEERSRVCDEFRSGALDILVATNCLSRGMDFPLLKSVINFDIPTSEKDYIHRVGRASRGGKIGGKSITFFTTPDHPYLYGIAKQIMASGGTIPQYLETLLMGKEDSKNSKPVVPSSGCNIRQNGDKEPRKLGKTSKRYSTIAKQIRRNTKHGIPRRKPFQLPDTVKFI